MKHGSGIKGQTNLKSTVRTATVMKSIGLSLVYKVMISLQQNEKDENRG